MGYTIKDIASQCGVGIGTVSRVINGASGVSEKTRLKVLNTINNSNYIPNQSARNLGMNVSNSIGVMVKGISNPFFAPMIKVIERHIADSGYTMVLRHVYLEQNEIAQALSLAKEQKLLGIVFLGGSFNHPKEELEKIQVPYVFCTATNIFGDVPESFSSVSIDDKQTAMQAVDYACSLGHKNIAILAAKTDDFSISQLRFEGYKLGLLNNAIKYDKNLTYTCDSFAVKDAYNVATELFSAHEEVTCVFCISDIIAVGAMSAARDAGYKIGKDMSVVSIDDIELTEYFDPPLCAFCQPAEQMATTSITLLIDLLLQKQTCQVLTYSTTLRKGGSLGAIIKKI